MSSWPSCSWRIGTTAVNPLPENMYNTAAVIDADNVDYFFAENMPTYETSLYNY